MEHDMRKESVSEALLSFIEGQSDLRKGIGDDQLVLEILIAAHHDIGIISTDEWKYLTRRIESNK